MTLARLGAIGGALLFSAGATGASDVARLRPGIFLYAAPDLTDPNFSQSVVLLVQHGPEGAMGFVINRPTDTTAEEALGAAALRGLLLYRGGPVQEDLVMGLVRTRRAPAKAVRVIDGVFMTGRSADLQAAARDGSARDSVRVYSGYAGWAAGQLEAEVQRGGWVIAPADAAAVFAREPEALWRRVYQLMQRREALLSIAQPQARPFIALAAEEQRHHRREHDHAHRKRQAGLTSDTKALPQAE